jgi:hypothetical protein
MSDSSLPDPSSSDVIPPEAIAAIDAGFAAFDQYMLPYLDSAGAGGRVRYPMGDKSGPFVDKVAAYMETHPEFIPPQVDKAAFQRNLARVQALTPYKRRLDEYKRLVDDTVRTTGSDLMTDGALPYYRSSKEAAKSGMPGAATVSEDLGERFAALRASGRTRRAVSRAKRGDAPVSGT